MGSFPWGPHGPEVAPHTVTPNPTAPSPIQQIGSPDYAQSPVAVYGGGGGGGGSGLGGLFAQIIFGLVMVVMLWIPMACLYPMTALAAIIAGFTTAPILARLLPADGRDVASVVGFAVGAAVVFVMFRVEIRMAENPGFRFARHAVRLVLLAIWAIPIIMLSTGATAPSTTTRFIFAVVTSPRVMVRFLMNPVNLGILTAVVVGLHFLLWKAERLRRFWHRRLVFVGLK